jgi:anti-anti-sigma factor
MMTISPFSASSESRYVGHNVGGGTAADGSGSAVSEPRLRVVPTHFGAQTILALVGELDRSNTDTMREAVDHCLARQPGALSLDLSGVTYCGAAGARSLRWVLRRAEAGNVEFRLVALPAWLRRVLTAVEAHDLLAATSDQPDPT